MKTILMLGLAAVSLAASSQPTGKVPCAAKPFALAKPAPPVAKAVPQPVKKTAPVKAAEKPAKPLADCKKKPAAG